MARSHSGAIHYCNRRAACTDGVKILHDFRDNKLAHKANKHFEARMYLSFAIIICCEVALSTVSCLLEDDRENSLQCYLIPTVKSTLNF